MPLIQAAQHLFASVERGYFPKHGRGFQTVAMTPELMGTEDLRVLEEVAFYSLSRERRQTGNLPVKETFLQLPSENFAIGRTIYLGVDSMGREGNYLSHHLILSRESLMSLEANPFVLLDSVEWADAQIDLKPRELTRLSLNLATQSLALTNAEEVDLNLLSDLALMLMGGLPGTPLLIGSSDATRKVIEQLFSLVPQEERLSLNFSSHFYESDHLQKYYQLASIDATPSASSTDFRFLDLETYQKQTLTSNNAYANWLSKAIQVGNLTEVKQVNTAINRLRLHQPIDELSESPSVALALWERLGTDVSPALFGNAARLQWMLSQVPKKRELAEALLAVSPTTLIGSELDQDVRQECLTLLKHFAGNGIWKEWAKRWRDDPVMLSLPGNQKQWWQIWKR